VSARATKKQQTRERLLEAAAKVFAAKGYFGAAVDDIADAAGLTKGAVYAHFRTKEALYLALTIERGRHQIDAIRERFDGSESNESVADWVAKGVADVVRDRAQIAIDLEFLTYAARDPKLRRELKDLENRGTELAVRLTEKLWTEHGRRPSISARDFHRLINGLAAQLSTEALLNPKEDFSQDVTRLVRFLFDAL